MKYKKLNNTDIKLSTYCLGTMTWGQQNTEKEGHEQMDIALDAGVNFFDTAELYAVPPMAETYGKTEEIIGTWFKERKNRDKVFLASKVVGAARPMKWIREGQAILDKKNILAALEQSLKRLKTDYIDLYQLHWPNRQHYHFGNHYVSHNNTDVKKEEELMLEVLETLDEQIKVGKIRHIGLSNETSWGTLKYLELSKKHSLPRMLTIQNEYSLLCRHFDKDLHEVSLVENIGLLAWSPLVAGAITGKYLGDVIPKGTRRSIFNRSTYRQSENSDSAIKEYIELAKDWDLDVCHMAIAFTLSRPFTTASIVGATSAEQLKHNLKAVDVELDQEILKEINKIHRKYPRPF